MSANAGGVHVGDGRPTTVEGSEIDGNSAIVSDPQGEPYAIGGGMIVGDSPLAMGDSHVDRNQTRVDATTLADAGAAGSAFELDGGGTIDNTSISHNLTSVTALHGDAGATGTLAVLNFNNDPSLVTVRRSVIVANAVRAHSATGSAEGWAAQSSTTACSTSRAASSRSTPAARRPRLESLRAGASGTVSTSPDPTLSSRSATPRCSATASPQARASRRGRRPVHDVAGDSDRDGHHAQPA